MRRDEIELNVEGLQQISLGLMKQFWAIYLDISIPCISIISC